MTHHRSDSKTLSSVLELLAENGFEGMATAIELLMNEAMQIERSEWLRAAPYERSAERRGWANGFKAKRVKSRLGELELRIPKVRDVQEDTEPFYPHALERGERSERAFKLALAEMYVQGVSTRKVTEVTRELCGLDVSSTQVSRVAKLLDDELQAWRTRPLGEFRYLFLDARYEKVRHGGSVVSSALLFAVGVDAEGRRSILGTSVSLSEAEVHWRDFLADLQDRGLHGVRLVTSDHHAGLKAALSARMPGVPWQRCQFHLQQNAQAFVPRTSMRKQVARELRGIFDAPDRNEAVRRLRMVAKGYREISPKLADWLEDNVPDSLTVFAFPPTHRRRLRTTNLLERLSREIKRRTRVASLFPNEASLLRLATAVLVEVSEGWEAGHTYLRMDAE